MTTKCRLDGSTARRATAWSRLSLQMCMGINTTKATTHQADLTKLPRALAPLIERPQWASGAGRSANGKWQKPPFMAPQPDRHASTKDPSTWTEYARRLAAVQAGHGDGISYMLTED